MAGFIAEKRSSYKEPLLRITKKSESNFWKSLLVRVIAILAALLTVSLISYLIIGESPIKILNSIIRGAFGTSTNGKIPRRTWILFQEMAILLIVSLGVTPAFKMKFWNIGAEGQVLVGALASTACVWYLQGTMSEGLLLVVMLLASVLASCIWALIPGLFKALFNTNETLFTLMMNYVATSLVSFFISIWVTGGSGVIGTLKAGYLPQVLNKQFLPIVIILVITLILFIYLKFTKQGYEISVVGESLNTARYIGINVKKVIIRTMLICGAICGVAGFLLVSGISNTLNANLVEGRGFTAILVSWLAKFNPLYMCLTSFLVVFLDKGFAEVVADFKIGSSAYSDIVIGLIFLFIIGCEFFINYKVIFRGKKSLGYSIVAAVCFFIPVLPVVFGILGLVKGIKAYIKEKNKQDLAAIIVSGVALLLSVAALAVEVVFILQKLPIMA